MLEPNHTLRAARIVLTGGPGGGKTTAADLFRREIGERVVLVPEAATMLFTGGFPRVAEPHAVRAAQSAIFHVQRNLEDIQVALNPGKISGACGRLMCCLAYELTRYRESAERLPPVGAKLKTGQGLCVVTRTDLQREAVWIKDSEGAEHRILLTELPPGPYHQCGDCNCGKKSKKNGDAGAAIDEPPPDAWADPPAD